MSYLPRPEVDRVQQDVDEIYLLTVEELRGTNTPAERREAFQRALRKAYDAGVDAQREIVIDYEHSRPTPVPPPPDEDDPGTLPTGPHPQIAPSGAFQGRGPVKSIIKTRRER